MLLSAACVAPVVAYDATTILPEKSLRLLPAEIAGDGKTYVYTYDSDYESGTTHFYIYDEDFQLAKEFVTLPAPKGEYSYQTQRRETIPVSATSYYERQYGDSPLSINGVSENLTIDMVLNYLHPEEWEITTLKDGTQVVAKSGSFHDEDYLGKKYPQYFYKQVDGLWFLYNVSYESHYAPYGEWMEPKTDEGASRSSLFEIEIKSLEGADGEEVNLTRGIFSNDFNYVYPEYRKVEYSKEDTYEDTDWVYWKEWGYKSEVRALKVYDSSNKEVATLEIPDSYKIKFNSYYENLRFIRLGNKKYIVTDIYKEGTDEYDRDYFTAIYLIDGNNSVKLLTIAPSSKISPRTPRQGETVTVTFDDSSISSERTVQVVSTSGRLMHQAKVHAGETSIDIDTSRLQQGMYIVNILTEGRAREAAKIIVR